MDAHLVHDSCVFVFRNFIIKQKKSEFSLKPDFLEVPVGFEPTNKGFADLPLKPLGYSTKNQL